MQTGATTDLAQVPCGASPPTYSVSISGLMQNGATLTASTSGWPAGTTFSYQWQTGGSNISGATSSTFTPTFGAPAYAAGKFVTVNVTGSYSGGSHTTSQWATITVGASAGPTTGTPPTGSECSASTGGDAAAICIAERVQNAATVYKNNNGGSYSGLTVSILNTEDPGIMTTNYGPPYPYLSAVSATSNTYTATVTSGTGATFTVSANASTLSYSCTGGGAYCAGGTWTPLS